MFEINVAPADNLVDIRLGGLMTVAEVDDYIASLGRAMIAHRIKPGYRMILDVSDCPIQTQDMMNAMRERMVEISKADAIAIVTGTSLGRMQVRRLFQRPYVRIVSTRDEARAWVLSGIEPAT